MYISQDSPKKKFLNLKKKRHCKIQNIFVIFFSFMHDFELETFNVFLIVIFVLKKKIIPINSCSTLFIYNVSWIGLMFKEQSKNLEFTGQIHLKSLKKLCDIQSCQIMY